MSADFVQRGLLLLERGEYQEVVKTCRLGLLGRPGAVEGRIVLGRALLALGRFDEVLAEMQSALEALPSYALAHLLRGEALLGKGDAVGARASLRLAAVLAPDDPEIAGKVRNAEAAAPRRAQRPPAPPADGTETKHYRRAAGSEPSVLEEDTATDDNPTSVLYGETRGIWEREAPAAPQRRDDRDPRDDGEDHDESRTSLREQRSVTFGEEASTTIHVADELQEELRHRELQQFSDDGETVLRTPVRASGTPAYGEAHPGRPLFPGPEDSAERRGPAEETLLTLPLSPQLNPGHSTANGRTSLVAKKKNTEPLSDDALVEVPPMHGGHAGRGPKPVAHAPGPGGGGYAAAGGGGKPPPRVPNIPSQPRRNPPGNSQPPPRPPPQVARPSKPMSVPPPIPSAPPSQPPGGNWQRVPVAGAGQQTVLAGPPPSMGPPPGSQPLPRPAPPPPSNPQPLGAQNAGAFQAYQTAIAAQPPGPPQAPPPVPPQALPARAPAPAMSMSMSDSMPVAAAPMPAQGKPKSKAKGKSKKGRRTGFATVLWILVAASVIGGGVFAGFQIRDLRLDRKIDAAEKRATESSASDTWQGWRTARDGLASIAAARRTAESRAVLARAQAVLAYEMGDGAQLASATLRPLGADSRTASARAYMALIAGDAAAAAREVGMISGDGNAANADYLRGRVALLSGDAKAAVAALEKSHRAEPRPFTTVALAEAYVAAERWDDARAALDAALAKSVDHPALVIAKASLTDRLGKHTPATSAEDIARLERVAAEGQKPATAQPRASRWQAAMALLTEAGLQLRRSEREAALASIARALDLGVDEQRLAEASVVALLGADLPDVATAGAKRGLTSWPQSMVLRTAMAQGAFAEGRMNEVIEALPDALIGKDPLALAVRARARLAAGDLEAARRDLDSAAAATSPELSVARSLLKLAAGETLPPAAAPTTRPDLALVQATAARLRGEATATVAMLEPLVRGPLGAERYTIRLELARAYRDAAKYPGARAAYAELSALKNPTVRLEAAQLLLEDRDPKGAREHIEALLRDVGDKATGLALIEAMRIRTLTGAASAAEALADRAFKAGAPPWMLHRETARIARRRDAFPAAVEALNKALDGSKADVDTLLLACDLVDGAPEAFVAKVTKAVDERLAGMPDQLVAQGKLAIARQERDRAVELFGKATQKFMEKPASARRVAQASFGVGALAVVRGDWVQAKVKLEAALELDPSLIDAYLYQAEALASSGALKQAIARLKVASEYNPESAIVWQQLERRASEANDKKTAADAAKRAQELLEKKPT